MSHSNRKTKRRYYALSPREFEEHAEESDRPTFRADTIEQGVLAKLQAVMSDERTKRSIRREITRRTRKVPTDTSKLESQIADVRAKIERGTENLALADPAVGETPYGSFVSAAISSSSKTSPTPWASTGRSHRVCWLRPF